jgi:hypothetical protein
MPLEGKVGRKKFLYAMDYLNLETFELLVKHNACILHYTVPKD